MDSNDISIVKITLDKGYKLVQEKKDKDNTPRYNRIAITKGDRMDLLDLMNELPKQESSTANFLKDKLNKIQYNMIEDTFGWTEKVGIVRFK